MLCFVFLFPFIKIIYLRNPSFRKEFCCSNFLHDFFYGEKNQLVKKNLFFLLIASLISLTGISQSATSIANGNWMNPFTWDCTCVPLPGYNVTINHNVALDTGLYIPSGSVIINSGASLTGNNPQRDIWLNGGSFSNSGTLGTIRYFLVQTGSFANSGSLSVGSFDSYVNFTNTGTFQNIDSMRTAATVINNGNLLNIDSIMTTGTFTNNGIGTFNQFTNTGQFTNNNNISFVDFTNLGTFTNADTLTGLNSAWNAETFYNLSSAYISLNNSFLNGDSLQLDAVFDNNGRMVVNDSWYNSDTIKGTTGSFQVADTSINWGWMQQTFDFCDLTPPASPPYIDYNFGTISSGITWCLYNSVSELSKMEVTFFPNPASNRIMFETGDMKDYEIKIYSQDGQLVKKSFNQKQIDISEVPAGLYFVQLVSEEMIWTKKIAVVK